LPLGLIWGLVFGFLEGRRTTEVLGAVAGSRTRTATAAAGTASPRPALFTVRHLSDGSGQVYSQSTALAGDREFYRR
ncbi:DUF5690 family protein, partial [Mycolicibacterium brumae]